MSMSHLFKAFAGADSTAPVSTENPKPAPVTPIDTQVTYQGTRLSLRAWAKHTGISEPTLRYRHRKLWSPGAVLGYEPPPLRDRAAEQRGAHETKVIILDGIDIISRRVAAAILKIQPQSLRRRLKHYRHQGKVTLTELKQSSRRL